LSFIERVKKFFRIKKQKGIVDSAASLFKYYGEPPEDDPSTYEYYYLNDPVVRAAVDFIAEMVAGVGYYTSCEDERAKQIVDEFAAKVNLDGLLLRATRNMLIYGNAYIEKVFDGKKLLNIKLLPSTNIRVKRDEHGVIEGYVQLVAGREIQFKPEEIVHLKYLEIGTKAYGISMIKPVLKFLEIKKQFNEDMEKIIHRYAAPKVIWKCGDEASVESLKIVLNNLDPDEDPIVSGDIQHEVIEIDPRLRFADFIEYLERNIFEGLGAPLLSYLRNATEASARAMLEAVERHVAGLQRYIKRKVESEIFKPLIEGYDLTEVPRLNWGFPRTKLDELTLNDIAQLVKPEISIINTSTARKWLQKMGFPIEEETEAETKEALGYRAKWVETPKQVMLILVDPNRIDKSSIRYYSIDANQGIKIMVAKVTGTGGRRWVCAIIFDKSKAEWDLSKAKMWYSDQFPLVFEFMFKE